MIYTKRQTTYTSRAGANTEMSLIGAVQIIEDSICEYFKSLDIDEINLKTKYNTIWVFTKNSVQFVRHLRWDEDFEVSCAITENTSAKIVVDTVLKDVNGDIAVQSKTEICLVDLATLRLKRIDSTFLGEDFVPSPVIANMNFIRPSMIDNPRLISNIVVPSTAIDYCGHVNNVEYIRFILNTYSAQNLKRRVRRFDISYISQSMEGESLDIYKSSKGDEDIFEIKSKSKNIARCRLILD